MKEICVFAPATIANLNVGFDVLGVALKGLGDKVHMKKNNGVKNRILSIKNGDGIPFEVEKNCCSVVIQKMQEHLNIFEGVDISIEKGFDAGSGLGSSSASSAAAAYGYNLLIGSPFSKKELIAFAAEGERLACGTAHLDNVAPALLGGLVLLHEERALSLPLPNGLFILIVFPKVKIHTKDARAILDQNIPITVMKKQIGNMAAFINSLYREDLELLGSSLKDLLIEPKRKLLIPKFDELKSIALSKGALAFGISGSGPSVFTICSNRESCDSIRNEMMYVYKDLGVELFSHMEPLEVSSGVCISNYVD